MKKPALEQKKYIITKHVMASSIHEAIKLEKAAPVQAVEIASESHTENAAAIGYTLVGEID